MKRGHGNVYQGPKDRPCRAFNAVKPRPQEPLPAGTRERKPESTDSKHLTLFPPPNRPPSRRGRGVPPQTQRESSLRWPASGLLGHCSRCPRRGGNYAFHSFRLLSLAPAGSIRYIPVSFFKKERKLLGLHLQDSPIFGLPFKVTSYLKE